MINVYFVRHGETDLNRTHVLQGQIDTHGINAAGRMQALAVANFALEKGLKGDAMLASPMRRTLDTAEPIAKALGLPIETDARLKEMSFGSCEGMSMKDLRATPFNPPLAFRNAANEEVLVQNGDQLRTWHASTDPTYDHLFHPGGETRAQVRARVSEAIFARLARSTDIKDLWVVSHGAVGRFMTAHYASPAIATGGVRNASILHFTYDPANPRTLGWKGVIFVPENAMDIAIGI